MKKTLTLLIAVSLLILSATPALAGDKGEVKLKTKKTAAILEGDTAWVSISWQAKKSDATNFKIVATTDVAGVTISYPENTSAFSSLMDNDTLSADEIDFTSLLISAPYGVTKIKLKVAATWIQNGKDQEKTYKVEVPVAKFTGSDVAQVTTDVGSLPNADNSYWVSIDWAGFAPIVTNVQMTVTGPPGAVISYPESTGTYSSLMFDDILVAGETDFTSVYVDTSAMAAGSYTLDLTLSYSKGGSIKTITGQVSLQVTG